jgi:O-antigen ligase
LGLTGTIVIGNASPTRFDPRAAGLLLAGGMCLIPFLQPRHMPPIAAFYDEWLAFGLGLVAMAFTSAGKSGISRLPVLAICLALFALELFARATSDTPGYPQSSLLWGIYAFFAALVVMLGHDLATHFGQSRVCDLLAGFLLAGALANSIAGVLQMVGIPREIDAFVSYLRGARAIGNVGQANLYANYLALGEASLVYLFARGKIGRFAGLACGALLVGAAALAASRASVLYAVTFALLGYLAIRQQSDPQMRWVTRPALMLGLSVIVAQWLIPVAVDSLGIHMESGFQRNAPFEGDGPIPDEATHLRLVAWQLAWRMLMDAPWIGVGPDAFAGVAFTRGLPPELAGDGIWTSPHNMVLHLLAETGLLGAALICIGVFAWLRDSVRNFRQNPDPARWFLLACASVECLHALLEYSLLYAHFLALTALIMGVAGGTGPSIRPIARRMLFASSAVAGLVLVAATLMAYRKFDQASPVAKGRSLASDQEVARDRKSLAQLSESLLAPRTELWLFLSFALDDTGLVEKVAVGERVLRFWPSRDVVVRQSIFLALSGRHEEAVTLLKQGVRTFRGRGKEIVEMVQAAPLEAREALREALPAQSQ